MASEDTKRIKLRDMQSEASIRLIQRVIKGGYEIDTVNFLRGIYTIRF